MGDNSRVTVKIFGNEYTIAGGASDSQITQVAAHVDKLMTEISESAPSMNKISLAILTAVNISNDFFEVRERNTLLESEIGTLRKDAEHYVKLWEDAKASFKQYKEDAQNSIEQLQELQRIFNMKNVELNKAKEALEDMTVKYEEIKAELEEEKANNLDSKQAAIADADETLKKYKELENSFFDIQMENIQLKNELDNLRNKVKSGK